MAAADEPSKLCEEILRITGGQDSIRFGDLVEDETVEQTFEALMGTLNAARKRGLIKFDGELLLKGQHDDVIIKLASEDNKENKENEPVEPVEAASDAEVHKQFLVEVPVETIALSEAENPPIASESPEDVKAEAVVETVEAPVEPPPSSEAPVEPPASSESKPPEQEPVDPSSSNTSAEEKEKRWAVDTSYIDYRTADPNNLEPRRGETTVAAVGDSGLMARSVGKTEDGKWQSVDTSYIANRTQDTSNLAARPTAGTGVGGDAISSGTAKTDDGKWTVNTSYIKDRTADTSNLEGRQGKEPAAADIISSGTAKGEDGKWTVNTSYIKDRTADTSNLDGRKSQSNIGSVASTATKKNSDGKWAVDTSYINYRTGDAALMRSKESANTPVYEDPAEKHYTYEEITSNARPAGIDPTKKEAYLSDNDFQTVLGVSRTEFVGMAKWKQQNLKKAKNLF